MNMTPSAKRFIAVTVIAVSALFSSGLPALADGNWNWTDLSDKIAERQNRPVWAMAYASPYWYFTDGQDLWSGGHVWKTEGSVIADITYDVRNAGISRVDDIVSDGQTVLFLKNVAPRSNSIEALSYNGSFTSLTSRIQQNLSYNEGIVSISGSNGTWGIMTSYGRVLLYSPSANTVRTIQLSSISGSAPYMQNHASGVNGAALTFGLQPTQGNWLAYWKGTDGNAHFEKVDAYGSVSTLTYPGSSNDQIVTFSSNGQNVFIGGTHIYQTGSTFAYVFDGSSFRTVSQSSNPYSLDNALVSWDGTSWMIIQSKNLYRFDGYTFQNLGQTRDLFLTAAGNGAGTFLLGGAVSDSYSGNNPSYPLTLKLAKAQETYLSTNTSNVTSNTTGGTYTSTYGPTITTSGSPSNFIVGNGNDFTYRASATDPNGVSRVDILANGAVIKTCFASSCDYTNTYFTNGASTRMLGFGARATDSQGYTTESPVENLTITANGTTNTNTNSGTAVTDSGSGISSWQWFEPSQSYIRRDQFVTYNVSAWDTDGINHIDIVVNGTTRRTCTLGNATGNQTCTVQLYGGDYSLNTNVSVNAQITDGAGKMTWTSLQNLQVVDTNGNYNNNSNTVGDISATSLLDPTGSVLNRNSTVTLRSQASATQGLSRIDVYVNGSIVRTCNFSQTYGTQSCDTSVYGSNYSTGSQVSMNAQATDWYGRTAYSNMQTVTIQDNNSNNTNNTNGNVSAWSWLDPSGSVLNRNSTATFRTQASANQGLSRIDVYVNGSIVRTCNFGQTYGTQSCDTTLYGSNYSTGSQLSMNAKATDWYGQTAWSNIQTVTIQDNGSNTNTNSTQNANGSTWISSSPDVTNLNPSDAATFTVNGSDPNGIQRFEMWVNGSVKNTCTLGNVSNGQCQVTIYGNAYTQGTDVFVNAKMTDSLGNDLWSGSRIYHINVNGTTVNPPPSNDVQGSVNITTSKDNGYLTGDLITYTANGSDPNGIGRITIIVNGFVMKTCTGQSTCSYTGGPYGSSLTYGALLVDTQGNAIWTGTKTLNRK